MTGAVTPSGKLGQTMVRRYEDHPSAPYIHTNKDHPEELLTYENFGLSAAENGSVGFEKSPVSVYGEDIYVGYRYFDTYQVPVLYPFGFGLSFLDHSVFFKQSVLSVFHFLRNVFTDQIDHFKYFINIYHYLIGKRHFCCGIYDFFKLVNVF